MSSKVSILVNGSRIGEFQVMKGYKQGDSFTLFFYYCCGRLM